MNQTSALRGITRLRSLKILSVVVTAGSLTTKMAVALLLILSTAHAQSVRLLRDSHGVGDRQPLCHALKDLLDHPDYLRKLKEPLCAWRFDQIPKGFTKFRLPKWKVLPTTAVTREVIREIWLAQAINSARVTGQDWRSAKNNEGKSPIDNPLLVQHIDRALANGRFVLSEAKVDIDFDGRRDRIRKLDITDCDRPFPELSGLVGDQPDYPLLVVLRANGEINDDKMPSTGPIQPFLYEGRTRLLAINTGVNAPNNWMRLAAPGDPILGVEVRETAAMPLQSQEKFPELSHLVISAPVCHLRFDQE